MSNQNDGLYFSDTIMNRHVGGKNPPKFESERQYVQDQLRVLKSENKNLPPDARYQLNGQNDPSNVYLRDPKPKYNLYDGFIYNNGLMQDSPQIRNFVTTFVDINSQFRNKKTNIITEEPILLESDPLEFTNNSSRLFIHHPSSHLSVGDRVTLTGVVSRNATLRSYRGINLPAFEIPIGANFMKIFFDHGIPLDYAGHSITVTLDNIRGDRNSSILGSIPTNIINTNHEVKLTLTNYELEADQTNDPSYFIQSPNYFFILLPIRQRVSYNLRDYNFKLIFTSLEGIPLNELNASFPIDQSNFEGYHIIENVSQDGYTIELKRRAVVNSQISNPMRAGGRLVNVSNIIRFVPGFQNPNHYSINLTKVYNNVISVRIVSSEIPNTQQGIKSFPLESSNNLLYWNNLDDGDFLYSLEVPSGTYDPRSLSIALEKGFSKVRRVSWNKDNSLYLPEHFVKVRINPTTNIVRFKSFKKFIVQSPITDILPDMPEDESVITDPAVLYKLTIKVPSHGITETGLKINIENSSILNGKYVVTSIIDNNRFMIELSASELLSQRINIGGGNDVIVYVPSFFRLRFDFPNTMGTALGFKNTDSPFSITKYLHKISNDQAYANEQSGHQFTAPIKINPNALQLCGDNYIIMVASPLLTFYTIGPIRNAFAKILLWDSPNKILFNSFVPMTHYYVDVLHELSELEISFFNPDGTPFNFNGLDHSFTLEIVTVNDDPDGTGIQADTGKNYNPVV